MLHRTHAARLGLIVALALVVVPGLHPALHGGPGEAGLRALSVDLEGRVHDPDCAICRVSSELRDGLQSPADARLPAALLAGPTLHGAGVLAPRVPTQRGPRARAPPSA